MGDYNLKSAGLSRRSGISQRDSDVFSEHVKPGARSVEGASQISGLSGDTRLPGV